MYVTHDRHFNCEKSTRHTRLAFVHCGQGLGYVCYKLYGIGPGVYCKIAPIICVYIRTYVRTVHIYMCSTVPHTSTKHQSTFHNYTS